MKRQTLQQPFERVLGMRLTAVWYYVLRDDAPGFELDAPNQSGGCQGVRLEFEGGDLELDWDSRDPGFRNEATCYYLAARSQSEREASVRCDPASNDAGLVRLDAAQSSHWRGFSGECLRSASVWGFELACGIISPQAVTLTFPCGELSAAIGMGSASGGSVGDGDEVLLFDTAQWSAQLATQQLAPHRLCVWEGRGRVRLDGYYRWEENLPGQLGYCAFELSERSLRQLAGLLQSNLAESGPLEVEVGDGGLRISPGPLGTFEAELSAPGRVSMCVGPEYLQTVGLLVEALADAVPDADYLPHVHLNELFSKEPVRLSDIVVERRDGNRCGA